MRGFAVPALVVAVVAGCGGEGASSPSITEPNVSTPTSVTAPPAASTTTEPGGPIDVVTPTTIAPSPNTSTTAVTLPEQPRADLALLRPDGIGPLDFGTPADEAIERLSALLGAPTSDEAIGPGFECAEGVGWLDCLRALRIVSEGRLLTWADDGFQVALVDSYENDLDVLSFGDWHATVASGDGRLTTEEGLFPGITVGELKRAIPGIQWTYNEGLLDSYHVVLPGGGGYWGRLDWNPATAAIDRGGVHAVQAALNDHGADLVVDGEWGPRSEAAWLEFLTDLGVEPFTSWPWLTPGIGEALGLPPDDITVATIEPRPALDGAITPAAQELTLRSDGLGRFDFGAPANDLVSELESLLGPPVEDVSYTPDGPGPFTQLPLGYWAAYQLRIVRWDEPDLRLVLSDVPFLGDHYGEPTPGTITLVSWATASPQLAFSNELTVGTPLAMLRAHHPEVVLGTFDVCETEYDPASFVTVPYDGDTPPLWRGFRGSVDWDWVSDLQRALNGRGASLAVDGEYGPRTCAAVTAFEEEIGVFHVDGLIDPETADALGLLAPDDALITHLEAGSPGSC